jgi:hypothetical protein
MTCRRDTGRVRRRHRRCQEIGVLEEAAARLPGFPKNPADVREFILGLLGCEFAGGAVSVKFYGIDQAEHAYVRSSIESDTESPRVCRAAMLAMPREARAIDRFVQDLERLEREKLALPCSRHGLGVYFRAKRSKSAIWRSISSRAESAAERIPWMRSWNSSGFVERRSASSRVMSCLV